MSAIGWIRHASCEEVSDGGFLHSPFGMQQTFSPIEGNMKYCAHERQPPHSNVAVSTTAIAKLAILLSKVML